VAAALGAPVSDKRIDSAHEAYQRAATAVLSAYREVCGVYGEARKKNSHSEADAIGLDYLDGLRAANKILSCDAEAEDLDKWFPYRGPCSCCGGPDARHRTFDAIIARCDAGEVPLDVADDYGVPLCAVVAVLQDQPYCDQYDDTLAQRVMLSEPAKEDFQWAREEREKE
jgi:hypothetical protein